MGRIFTSTKDELPKCEEKLPLPSLYSMSDCKYLLLVITLSLLQNLPVGSVTVEVNFVPLPLF
jgi:hypothetical protein